MKLPPLKPTDNHTILFEVDFKEGCTPQPCDTHEDKWDQDHVHMPCSPENTVSKNTSTGPGMSQWKIICDALNQPIYSSIALEKAIMGYNTQHKGRWDFRGLHSLFDKHFDDEYKKDFFQNTLPGMLKLSLELPQTCTTPIPLLRQKMDHSITMSQKQIACLLIHGFLCTYPNRREQTRSYHQKNKTGDSFELPSINFIKLFAGKEGGIEQRNREKLKCIFNYFSRVVMKEPTGTVTFHRQYLVTFPDWAASQKTTKTINIHLDGYIEKEGQGMLQVDFAHESVGGLVLEHGCVQEEIRFVISPELIISRLFMEYMNDEEAIIITGAEQYSKYKGYKDNFLYDGNFEDNAARDLWGRRCNQVVAMDALHFRKPDDQFQLPLIKRELHKAFAGFFDGDVNPDELTPVATGNWGCGVYKGSPHLKFLIQVMAASEANRSLSYFTFGEQKLYQDLKTMKQFITDHNLTIGNLWTTLESYSLNYDTAAARKQTNLYDYIYSKYKK